MIQTSPDKISVSGITIVDRGRGPQLSSNRITVQDVVPYLKRTCSDEQIMEIMPVLTRDEIDAIKAYVDEHFDEVMEQDRRIRDRNAERLITPEIEEMRRRGEERMSILREQFRASKEVKERTGDQAAG